MSEEESFVILGTSPNSLQSFASIGKEADEISVSSNNNQIIQDNSIAKQGQNSISLQQENDDFLQHIKPINNIGTSMTASSATELKYSLMDDSDENCKIKSVTLPSTVDSFNVSAMLENGNGQHSLNSNGVNFKTNHSGEAKPTAQHGSLAASFLMGDVQLDFLKANIYTQFPSLGNLNVHSTDIIKLQTVLSEHSELKDTLKKNNLAMRQYFTTIQKWQEETKDYKNDQNKQIIELKETIAKLHNENRELKMELDTQIELFKINETTMRKDNDDLIKKVSEQSAQIQNMTVQIQNLEQQNMSSFEYIPKKLQFENQSAQTNSETEYVSSLEHKRISKQFERQLSELTAKNLELEDMKNIYLDEINCLKVNLVSAEELLKQAQNDINILRSKDGERAEQMDREKNERDEMKQRMEILNTQVELYSKDFEMERTARENLAGEKDQILIDLRLLQKRNQQLIGEQQARYAVGSSEQTTKKETGTTRKKTTPPPASFSTPEEVEHSLMSYVCPLCNKSYVSLELLERHVQKCIDDN